MQDEFEPQEDIDIFATWIVVIFDALLLLAIIQMLFWRETQ
jgi:hypothetical protein